MKIKPEHEHRILEDVERLALMGRLFKEEIDAFVRDIKEIYAWNNNNKENKEQERG